MISGSGGKRFALCSGQFFFPTLLFFSLGVRTTVPTTTAGTVIHPQAGENTQILGTYSVGPLTTQKRKESEEPWLLGSSQGITLGKYPALMSRVKYSHARGPRKSGFHVVESKELPPDLECCSSSERCRSLDCLMLCLLKPKRRDELGPQRLSRQGSFLTIPISASGPHWPEWS